MMNGYYTIQFRDDTYRVQYQHWKKHLKDKWKHYHIPATNMTIPGGKMAEIWYYTRPFMQREDLFIEDFEEAQQIWETPLLSQGEARYLRFRDDFWDDHPSKHTIRVRERAAKKQKNNAS